MSFIIFPMSFIHISVNSFITSKAFTFLAMKFSGVDAAVGVGSGLDGRFDERFAEGGFLGEGEEREVVMLGGGDLGGAGV
jgi:hypothetical protein